MNFRGLVHVLAGMAGVNISFDLLPHGWNIAAATLWAGVIAMAAFLDQSLSKQ